MQSAEILSFSGFHISVDEFDQAWIVSKKSGEAYASLSAVAWMCEIDHSTVTKTLLELPESLTGLDLSTVTKIQNPNSPNPWVAIPSDLVVEILAHYAYDARGAAKRTKAKALYRQMTKAGASVFIYGMAGYQVSASNQSDIHSVLNQLKERGTELSNEINEFMLDVPSELRVNLFNQVFGQFMTIGKLNQPTTSLPASTTTMALPDPQIMATINDAFLNLNRSGLAMNKLFHFIDRIPTMKRMDEEVVREMAESLAEAGDTITELQLENDMKDQALLEAQRHINALKSEIQKFKAESKQSKTIRHVETASRSNQYLVNDLLVQISTLEKQLATANSANEALRAENTRLKLPRLTG